MWQRQRACSLPLAATLHARAMKVQFSHVVFTLFIAWRLFMAVFVRTAFDPDEYWQGPEVAHRLVFGCVIHTGLIKRRSILDSLLYGCTAVSVRLLHWLALSIGRTPRGPAAHSSASSSWNPSRRDAGCSYGFLTWEWAAGLRSYVHPLLFTPLLALLKVTSLDHPRVVQLAPRLTQAALALGHDAAFAAFQRAHFREALLPSALAAATLSWFNNFAHSRTFSNSLESTLHLCCLALWPRSDPAAPPTRHYRRRRALAIVAAALCLVVRPTSAPLFVPLAVSELMLAYQKTGLSGIGSSGKHVALLITDVLAAGMPIQGAASLLDRAIYGHWVFPGRTNLKFNVLDNSSANYGSHPPHWYLSQGLPAMLASLLPLVAAGVYSAARRPGIAPLWPLGYAAAGVLVFSAVTHKEFRFVLPSFELLLPYAAIPCEWAHSVLSQPAAAAPADSGEPQTAPVEEGGSIASRVRQRHNTSPVRRVPERVPRVDAAKGKQKRAVSSRSSIGAVLVTVLLVLQMPTLAYFALWHQRGTVQAVEWLAAADLPPVRALLPPAAYHRMQGAGIWIDLDGLAR